MDQFAILPRRHGVLFEDHDVIVHGCEHGAGSVFSGAGTFFVVAISGCPLVNGYSLRPGMYGCFPETVAIKGTDLCRALVVMARDWRGIFTLGGPIEAEGRLLYMNGCTDSGLIQPIRLGDPCLNGLFFPPGILQTAHRHPSHRIGVVIDGQGQCMTGEAGEPTPMRPGDVFIIPKQTLHWFETTTHPMRIIAFHPDSEFGPTDEKHQMLEATLV